MSVDGDFLFVVHIDIDASLSRKNGNPIQHHHTVLINRELRSGQVLWQVKWLLTRHLRELRSGQVL